MFPVRYGLNSYINLLRNSVFKGLNGTDIGSRALSKEIFRRNIMLPSS
jgi:hypothetical protein